MEFEYDPEKSRSNAAKHGIDFDAGQALWEDSGLLLLPSLYPDEPRYLAIGRLEVFTGRRYLRNEANGCD